MSEGEDPRTTLAPNKIELQLSKKNIGIYLLSKIKKDKYYPQVCTSIGAP